MARCIMMRGNLMKLRFIVFIFLCYLFMSSVLALDAPGDGGWISLGIPSYIHMGSKGEFYLNGTTQGSCGSVRPQEYPGHP